MSCLILNDTVPDVCDLSILTHLSFSSFILESWPTYYRFWVLNQLCPTSIVSFHSDQTDETVKVTSKKSESQQFSWDIFTPMDSSWHVSMTSCKCDPLKSLQLRCRRKGRESGGRRRKNRRGWRGGGEEDLRPGNCLSLEYLHLHVVCWSWKSSTLKGKEGNKQGLPGYLSTSCCYPHFVFKFRE